MLRRGSSVSIDDPKVDVFLVNRSSEKGETKEQPLSLKAFNTNCMRTSLLR